MASLSKSKKPNLGDLIVWWIPQIGVGSQPFTVSVDSVKEGVKVMDLLAEYDRYQLDNKIKPGYANTGGLEVFTSSGEWAEWWDDETGEDDPREWLKQQEEKNLSIAATQSQEASTQD
jgi:hypothetical protein